MMKRATIRCSFLLIGALLVLAACGGDKNAAKKSYTVGTIYPNPAAVEVVDNFKAEMSARGYIKHTPLVYA